MPRVDSVDLDDNTQVLKPTSFKQYLPFVIDSSLGISNLFRGDFLEAALQSYIFVNGLFSAAFSYAQALTGQPKPAVFDLIERENA